VHVSPLPTEEEIKQLRSSLKENQRYTDTLDVITLVLGTGMRAAELPNLRWSDVNLGHHYLTVMSGKGRFSRCIPFGPKVLGAIIHQRCRHPKSQCILGDSTQLAGVDQAHEQIADLGAVQACA
jgi:integrase